MTRFHLHYVLPIISIGLLSASAQQPRSSSHLDDLVGRSVAGDEKLLHDLAQVLQR